MLIGADWLRIFPLIEAPIERIDLTRGSFR